MFSASNRNKYQEFPGGKGGRCVGLTTLPPTCVDYLVIWGPQNPGTLWAFQASNGIALLYIIYYIYIILLTTCRKAYLSFLHRPGGTEKAHRWPPSGCSVTQSILEPNARHFSVPECRQNHM